MHHEHRYREESAYTPLHCGLLCGGDSACKSFDYDPFLQRCYLGSVEVGNDCQELVTDVGGSQHYAEVRTLWLKSYVCVYIMWLPCTVAAVATQSSLGSLMALVCGNLYLKSGSARCAH